MAHNRKEIRHVMRILEKYKFESQMYRIPRGKSVQKSQSEKTKINNHLDMDNNERFKNICIGFSIQCNRTMNYINQQEHQQISMVNKGLDILKQIQKNLLELQRFDKRYKNHLNNCLWCMTVMKPYARELEQVIADVDALVKGGDVDHGKNGKV